jgi:hypothetical protein
MKRSLLIIALLAFFSSAATAHAVQVYGTNYGGTFDDINGVNHVNGVATPLPGSPWEVGGASFGLYSFAISRDGTRGVAGFGFSSNALVGVRLGADGSVTAATPKISGPGGLPLAASPVLDVVYGNNTSAGIAAASQAADGGLTALPGSPFVTAQTIGDMAITPNGRFLYGTGDSNDGVVHRFALAANGAPSYLGSVSVPDANVLQVTPDGKYLLTVGNGQTGNDTAYSLAIEDNGSLEGVGMPLDIGGTSSGRFAIDRDSSLAVIPNSNLGKLTSLKIAANGELSSAGEQAVGGASTATFAADGNLYLQRLGSSKGIYFAPRTGATTFGAPVELLPVNWIQTARVSLRPTAGGVAQFSVAPLDKPLTFRLDASASTGTARYDWNLGPLGARSSTTPVTELTFGGAGTYSVGLSAFDANGCGGGLVYTGQSAVCSDAPAARKTVTIDTPPWITSLKISPKTLTSKSKIKFKLTESASVSFYAQKAQKGRLVGTSCKKQTTKNAKAKKCTLWVRASATFRKSGKAGKTNSLKFTGKVGKKQIAPGNYRLYAVATDSAKGKGPAKTANFKIKKKKK